MENLRDLDDSLMDLLWQLNVRISEFWKTTDDPSHMKSALLTFISNRMEVDIRYLTEYVNYGDVIRELIAERGEDEAYHTLFTDPSGNITPPFTNFARAKQFVVNEFIYLNLSLGGFKTFGDPTVTDGVPLNYPGYIGGLDKPQHVPYRTYKP